MARISIIIPVYNEELNIKPLYKQLSELAASEASVVIDNTSNSIILRDFEWEFLFVNDGSSDNSLNLLCNLHEYDPRVNVLNFSRNFGKETALLAGMDFASGDAVILMDADLQHPVKIIPEMIYWWQKGFDDVFGERISRSSGSKLRNSLTNIYYRLLQNSSKTEVLANAGDFRLLSRRTINAIISLRECQRYTKGLYCWVGFNKKGIPFKTNDRQHGKSTFNFKSLFNLAIDGITSYTTSPLRIASAIGLFVSAMSIIYLIIVLIKYLCCGEVVQGYPTIICLILFLGGAQLLSLGIIGEYIGRIFNESKRRPPYIVESFNGKEPDKNNTAKL